jgi:hypothetical protein
MLRQAALLLRKDLGDSVDSTKDKGDFMLLRALALVTVGEEGLMLM